MRGWPLPQALIQRGNLPEHDGAPAWTAARESDIVVWMSDTITSSAATMSLPDNGQPVHERLAGAVEAAIAEGRYRPGERLPTHRQLAQQFSVSIGSVTRAIDSLSTRGVVRGEIGRGTFVLAREEAAAEPGCLIDLTIHAPPPILSAQRMAEATALA